MKAIVQDRYGSADALELRDIDKPTPADNEVLIRVHAAGVNAADWHLMRGRPYLVRTAFGIRAPKVRVRGLDVAGRVEAIGQGVTQFQPGDEVYGTCNGAFAEYASARPDKIATKPANLTFEQAAAVPIAASTALQGLRDAGKVQPGQVVLVIGAAGGVGSYAVQLAKAFGAHVTGVCSTTKVDLVRSLGADAVIDYTRDDIMVSGQRYDLILDTAGNRSLSHLRRALTPKGTLVIVGGEGGGPWFGGIGRQLGASLLSPFARQNFRMFTAKVRQEDLLTLNDLIAAGKVTPLIDRTYPLSETPDAIRYLEGGNARGKVVITV